MTRIRKSLGLSKSGLADELGVNRSSITRYESGKVEIPLSREKALKLLQQVKESAA